MDHFFHQPGHVRVLWIDGRLYSSGDYPQVVAVDTISNRISFCLETNSVTLAAVQRTESIQSNKVIMRID